jgi:hypothetical protein
VVPRFEHGAEDTSTVTSCAPCRDAAAAIATVVRAKRWCCGIDLVTIRTLTL